MIKSSDCLKKYGDPSSNETRFMNVWDVPSELEHGHIPKKIYCNKDMNVPLEEALRNVIERGLTDQIKTWDGCFNKRKKRGLSSMSLHSWGIAVDVNAAWNGLNMTPTLSPEFVKCFTDAGFDWGGVWTRKDGMHFQLSKI